MLNLQVSAAYSPEPVPFVRSHIAPAPLVNSPTGDVRAATATSPFALDYISPLQVLQTGVLSEPFYATAVKCSFVAVQCMSLVFLALTVVTAEAAAAASTSFSIFDKAG